MSLRYWLGAAISIPLLPILYFQGKRIRATIPSLPEATGPTGVSQPKGAKEKSLTLITIGESTIAGVGADTHAEGFSGTLAKELANRLKAKVDWRVYARSGYTAKRVGYKLLPKIEEEQLDLIVIGLGGNDAFTLNRPWQWQVDIREIITKLNAQFPTASIVFINMPPIKEFPAFTPAIKFVIGNLVEILGKSLSEVVQQHDNVHYLDEVITTDQWTKRYAIEDPDAEFFSDGVHPSTLTYQTWAKDAAINIVSNKSIRARLGF